LSAVILRSAADEITEVPANIFNDAVLQRRIRVIGEVTDTADIQVRLRSASQADLEEANRRFHIVSRALRGEAHDAVPPRTLRRWIAAYQTGEGQDGNGYTGLLPKPNQGNTTRKLSERARALMDEHIEKDYESLKQKTMYAAWAALGRVRGSRCSRRGCRGTRLMRRLYMKDTPELPYGNALLRCTSSHVS
jgi:hypothetical protein